MSTEGNTYRFMPSSQPMVWLPFHAATMTRAPGRVEMRTEDGKRWFTWTREQPVKGRKPKTTVITTSTVAELSAALDAYFASQPS